MEQFDIPILMLVFNRPETTQRVLEKVLEMQPQKLYVVADGPRLGIDSDFQSVYETRVLFDNIPESIELITIFRKENIGCRKSVVGGLTWFFSKEEMGIILEDDCLPNDSFFYFMKECLNKYREEEKIMHISGDNFQFGIKRGELNKDYYFSNIPHVWGWATWRRAWEKYDEDHNKLKQFLKQKKASDFGFDWFYYFKHQQHFNKATSIENRNIWDYRWHFIIWYYGGISIIPNVNLVQNIGFGTGATHTNETESIFSEIPTEELSFPLRHPEHLQVNHVADNYSLSKVYGKNWRERILKRFKISIS